MASSPSQPAGRGSPATPIEQQPPPDRSPRTNATTAAYAASVRGLTAQAIAFYFRAPVKAFFRTRVDYLAYVRAIILEEERQRLSSSSSSSSLASSSPYSSSSSSSSSGLLAHHQQQQQQQRRWLAMVRSTLRSTTPGVLAGAVRRYGWRIIPDHVLPPLVANVAVGGVLYASYLHLLGQLHEPSSQHRARTYPPPPVASTAAAGLIAGGLQSVVAAPLDAIQARYDSQAAATPAGRVRSMWAFGADKLREIGLRGMFAGWGMALAKDALGCALFFAAFEYVKAQAFCRFVEWRYCGPPAPPDPSSPPPPPSASCPPPVVRPHYALEPAFLLLAGVTASIVQQVVGHPIGRLQAEHWTRLEDLDAQAARLRSRPEKYPRPRDRQGRMLRAYVHAYRETWAQCRAASRAAGLGGAVAPWLYRGFWWATVRQVPSTSAGLIIFELVRRRYGAAGGERVSMGGKDVILG